MPNALADLLAAARAARAAQPPDTRPPTKPHYHYAFPHGSECTRPGCPDWAVEGLGPGWCRPEQHAEGCPMRQGGDA